MKQIPGQKGDGYHEASSSFDAATGAFAHQELISSSDG